MPHILKFSLFSFGYSMCILAAVQLLSGCAKKADVSAQVNDLEKAFPGSAAAAPAPVEATAPVERASPVDANAYVSAALTAVRSNDYAGSVITLQKLERVPGVTYQQFVAIQRTKLAMTTDLINRADRGDAKAKAELDKIEKTMSQ